MASVESEREEKASVLKLKNPNLPGEGGEVDYLYHLGLDTSMPLKEMFGDVRFVVTGGSPSRAQWFAQELYSQLQHVEGAPARVPGLGPVTIGKTDRYSLYKIGPVISVSHGMGMPSASILLHEIAKLLHYAGCRDDVTIIRAGTSGGLGVPAGTVVISTSALDGHLRESYTLPILGKERVFSTVLDPELAEEIFQVGLEAGVPVCKGKTMATDCFYEGQGRTDGAICDYTAEEKFQFLHQLRDLGVRNIEMESAQFSAFTGRLHIKSAIVCVTIINRLEGDQITTTKEETDALINQGLSLVITFLKKKLSSSSSSSSTSSTQKRPRN